MTSFVAPLIAYFVIIVGFIIYLVMASMTDTKDRDENTYVTWLNPADPVHPSHGVSIVSFTVANCNQFYTNFDFYIKLRGTLGDSPLILYRDYDEAIYEGKRFNFGIHLPIVIGSVYAMDIIFNHPQALDEEYLVTLTDFEVRDAWWIPWADVGKPKHEYENTFTFTARSTSCRIDLLYTKQKFGYKQMHYLWGALQENRLPWGNIARLDTVMTMMIDNLFVCFLILIFNHFDWLEAPATITIMYADSFSTVMMAMLRALLMAEACCLIDSLFSPVLWRLLQKAGGKGITAQINVYYHDEDEIELYPSTATQVIIRTIECCSIGMGYSTAVARKMRVEPLPTNCVPGELVPQSIAYIRTKMTRLTQDPASLNGKASSNINRMQTSRPTKSDRGAGNKVSGMRFTAENVEQYDDKVYHNTVVCEVYRASTGAAWGNEGNDGLADSASVAEMIFHFSDEGMKDRTPQEWAMASGLKNFKQKGLQGLGKHGADAFKNEKDGMHWFGRRSTVARGHSVADSTKGRFTFIDNFRRAPRATAHQPTSRQTNWDGVNAWKAKKAAKFDEEEHFYEEIDPSKQMRRRSSMKQGRSSTAGRKSTRFSDAGIGVGPIFWVLFGFLGPGF